MNHAAYQLDLPSNPETVVFCNGIKALNLRGILWLWRQLLTANLMGFRTAPGCIEAKGGICNLQEVVIVTYWQDEASLMKFFSSPLHRQMMKNTKQIIAEDQQAIALFNETYRPLRTGRYFNEPQGLAKIYPAIEYAKVEEKL
jgi:heme-degrading monooxygenase HmoA